MGGPPPAVADGVGPAVPTGNDGKAAPSGAPVLARRTASGDRLAALEEERRELLAALQAAESRFQSTVERSVDGIIVVDSSGRVRFANPAAEEIFGRGPDLVGTDFGQPVVAGDTEEIDVIRPGMDPVVAEMRVAETNWDGGPALLVLIRDVTDRRAAEERERELIREQTARAEAEAQVRRAELLDQASRRLVATLDLDELLRSLADLVVERLGDACLIDIDDQNGPLRRLTAARRDYPDRAMLRGLEDRPVRLALHTPEARVFRTGKSELVAQVTPDWIQSLAGGDEPASALTQLHPCSLMMVTLYAGTLRWGVVTILSCDPEVRYGPADLAVAEELVRRAGMTIENARLFRLAQEASRAKSDFLAIMSHELRTPLSAIVGYSGILEEGIAGELNADQREYLTGVRRSAEHLMRLIEQVITFARLEGDHERVQFEPVDLERVTADVATLTRPLADRRGLVLVVERAEGVGTIQSDERKISQILVNLVTNAIKYSDGGEVRLRVEVSDDEALLQVTDAGPGIPQDKLGEIFEPFRQLEDPRTRREGGAGLGLSVVKNLTRLLGGEIGVESTPGQGSTFSVRLPTRHASGAAAG